MVKNLWKGKRGARDDAHAAEGGEYPEDQPEYESVGDTLRKRREERGEDLRYVAQMLRIRYPYLKAIEDGQPDELPGPTYAVGFVRTYADHLGLPSEDLVQRFKEEAANLQARADLHFPAPIPEGKIPSGAVLVIAVVLAAAVYGGWIYLSSEDQQVAEIVPQLPNKISEIIKGDSKDAPDATETASSASSDKDGESQSATADTPESSAEDKADTGAPAAKSPEPEPEQETASATAASDTTETADAAAAAAPGSESQTETARTEPEESADSAIPAPPGTEAARSDDASEEETQTSSFFSSETTEPDADDNSVSETENEPSAEADRAPPKTYGDESGEARIVIHAAADSWVEVRDSGTDELLLTRVLFKGDRYMVPDRTGLTLLTGNAGGLRIVVDGTDVPAIGPLGAVRRNVLLEPSPLLAGNAARPTDGGSVRTQSQTSEGDFQAQ